MEAHGAAIRRLDEVPPQIPPPGWEASTPIDTLAATLDRWEREIGLERDPEWQRPHVWTEAQRSRWMEHILQGGYGGRSILLSCRGWQGRGRRIGPVVLVDGKQRVETVRRFLAGEVAVFGRRLHEFEDHAERRWRRGRSAELTLCMHALETRADVIRWYLQMNGGGTPHAPEEIARVERLLAEEQRREEAPGGGR